MIISEELKEFVASVGLEVLAATVTHDDIGTKLLKPGFSDAEWHEFLSAINVDYLTNWEQALWGNIWFKDGTWAERFYADGSEWWEHMVMPSLEKAMECN